VLSTHEKDVIPTSVFLRGPAHLAGNQTSGGESDHRAWPARTNAGGHWFEMRKGQIPHCVSDDIWQLSIDILLTRRVPCGVRNFYFDPALFHRELLRDDLTEERRGRIRDVQSSNNVQKLNSDAITCVALRNEWGVAAARFVKNLTYGLAYRPRWLRQKDGAMGKERNTLWGYGHFGWSMPYSLILTYRVLRPICRIFAAREIFQPTAERTNVM